MAVTLAGGALANEIYKWTDAEGNVHYGDRPAENVEAERLAIRSRPTDRARVAAATQARREARQRASAAPPDEPAEDAVSPEERRRMAAERAQKCSTYKERLQLYVQSRRLYREDENGERVYLSEQEMQDARDEMQGKVLEFCDS